NHPELELRVFLAPAAVDGVIEGLVHALCFENGAEFSLVTPVGRAGWCSMLSSPLLATSTGSARSFLSLAGWHIRVRARGAIIRSSVGRTSHVRSSGPS